MTPRFLHASLTDEALELAEPLSFSTVQPKRGRVPALQRHRGVPQLCLRLGLAPTNWEINFMPTTLEVLFSPAEFSTLKQRDLRDSTCVVFDILRATTTMMTALANGAEKIIPVTEISEAIALRKNNPSVLLAGERDGQRILAAQTGGIDFDLGNSPREFIPEKVRGKTIVMTTTNGTRALQACVGAKTILIGSFLNLKALARWLAKHEKPAQLIFVCAGTFEQTAFEDVLAAGVLGQELYKRFRYEISDSGQIAWQIAQRTGRNLLHATQSSRNARRLLRMPDLAEDVVVCFQRDTINFVAKMEEGVVKKA